jgi:hypothetical protein
MEAGTGLDRNSYDNVANWGEQNHSQIQFWRDRSHYSHFLRRVDAILDESPNARFYLAADLDSTYELFSERYGAILSCLRRTAFDRSKEQLVYALADAILLSRCVKLLGSNWSSFSELAMRLSTTISKIELSGKDF